MDTSFRTVMPQHGEFAPYYDKYISAVSAGDILLTLTSQKTETLKFLAGISKDKANFAYAPGKWSVKEVVGHFTDAERIFSYRALRIGRGDKTPLAGYDHDEYVKIGRFAARELSDLTLEFEHVRTATLSLIGQFDFEAWLRRGTATTYEVSTRALAWIMAGHVRHHVNILKELYLK